MARKKKKRAQPQSKAQPSSARPDLKARAQAWYADKSPVLGFAFKFGVLLLLFYALESTRTFDRTLYAYLEANAWLANLILDGMGQHSTVSEVTIASPHFAIAVRRGCDAVEPTWLVCAAILSFPASIRQKIRGIIWGVVLLQMLNLVRIVTLYWIGIHIPSIFDTAHVEIWPTVFIIVAIVIFILWRGKIAEPVKAHVP